MLAKIESPNPMRLAIWLAALSILLLINPHPAEAKSSSRHTVNCNYKGGRYIKTVRSPRSGAYAPPHVFYIAVRRPGEYRFRLESRAHFGIKIFKRKDNGKWRSAGAARARGSVVNGRETNSRWTSNWIRKKYNTTRWTFALRVTGYADSDYGPQRIGLFWTTRNCQRTQARPRCKWQTWAGRRHCMCSSPREPTVLRGKPDSHCRGIRR